MNVGQDIFCPTHFELLCLLTHTAVVAKARFNRFKNHSKSAMSFTIMTYANGAMCCVAMVGLAFGKANYLLSTK